MGPKLILEWKDSPPFQVPTCVRDYGVESRGTSLCVYVANVGRFESAGGAGVYIEQIRRNGDVVWTGRAQLAWEDGSYELVKLPSGKHRGAVAKIGQSDQRHESFAFAVKPHKNLELKDDAEYVVKLVADCDSSWVPRSELVLRIKYRRFTSEMSVCRIPREPWHKRLF